MKQLEDSLGVAIWPSIVRIKALSSAGCIGDEKKLAKRRNSYPYV